MKTEITFNLNYCDRKRGSGLPETDFRLSLAFTEVERMMEQYLLFLKIPFSYESLSWLYNLPEASEGRLSEYVIQDAAGVIFIDANNGTWKWANYISTYVMDYEDCDDRTLKIPMPAENLIYPFYPTPENEPLTPPSTLYECLGLRIDIYAREMKIANDLKAKAE